MDDSRAEPRTDDPTVPPPDGPGLLSEELRSQLTIGEDVIDTSTWAGSIPQVGGTSPHVRMPRGRWFNLLWLGPIGFLGLIIAIPAAKGLRDMPAVADFIQRYPGISTSSAAPHPGFPAWLGWQHFFNLFLMMFMIRAGLQILADHPRLYWTRHSTPGKEWFRFQKPVPDNPLWTAKEDSVRLPSNVGLPGLRHTIGLARWWHLGTDVFWLANGVLFYVLLFTTSQWERVVPTSWDVFPNALSTLIQYASLDWPPERGWLAYNGLQLIAYFVTIFIAAPLALITGLGMSPALSTRFRRVSKFASIQVARSLHFLVLIWFLTFIVMHVTMVFTTGLLNNLNHIYAMRNDDSWTGFWVFAASMVVVVAAWLVATPFTLRHPRVVQKVGATLLHPFERWFAHVDAKPGVYTDDDISEYFWHNGRYPDSEEYQNLADGGFADYRLHISGLVAHPIDLSVTELRELAHHEQITQHFCIQGWSGIAKWGGVSMQTILDLAQPDPSAEWVAFYSYGEGADGGPYYDLHPIAEMHGAFTMLAYDMNGAPLTFGHGAPLRLRNEIQLGFKQVKWIKGIEFVASIEELGGGYGGYNEDHEFFGYRQAI